MTAIDNLPHLSEYRAHVLVRIKGPSKPRAEDSSGRRHFASSSPEHRKFRLWSAFRQKPKFRSFGLDAKYFPTLLFPLGNSF